MMAKKTVLLVADISGFTKFMKLHTVATNHAKQIIVRLLKSLMQVAQPPLKVAELEGDAIFFYAVSENNDVESFAENVKKQVMQFFSTFKKEMEDINGLQSCHCHACDRVSDLKLKQVIHVGDVEIEKIDRFEKLFGLDVILVHRMLKNSVPSREYLMMSEPMFKVFRNFFNLEPERRVEKFEGLGEVQMLVFYPSRVMPVPTSAPARGLKAQFFARARWRLKITTGLFLELIGLKRIKGSFNNIPVSEP